MNITQMKNMAVPIYEDWKSICINQKSIPYSIQTKNDALEIGKEGNQLTPKKQNQIQCSTFHVNNTNESIKLQLLAHNINNLYTQKDFKILDRSFQQVPITICFDENDQFNSYNHKIKSEQFESSEVVNISASSV